MKTDSPNGCIFASEYDDVISLETLGNKASWFDPTVGSPIGACSKSGTRSSRRAASTPAFINLPYIQFAKTSVSSGNGFDASMVKDDYDCSKCRRVNHCHLQDLQPFYASEASNEEVFPARSA